MMFVISNNFEFKYIFKCFKTGKERWYLLLKLIFFILNKNLHCLKLIDSSFYTNPIKTLKNELVTYNVPKTY